jgi:hypothetical protein
MAMTEAELTKAINRIDKRLDWIEESLGRLPGLRYVPMGRSDTRPDETGVPADVAELARAGKTMEPSSAIASSLASISRTRGK